jgi:two-component system, OmpR family, phosphate regulon sensor histidine kinase PhoR
MTFRLHSRLVTWNLLIVGLISLILGYFLITSLRDDLHRQIEQLLLNQTAVAAAYLANLPEGSFGDSADELSRLLQVRVTLVADDGRVLADSGIAAADVAAIENHRARPEIQQALQQGTGAAIRFSPTVHTEFLYVARRQDRFVLRLAMPLSSVDFLIRDLRSQLAFAMSVAIGVTLVFGYVVRGLISTPLRELAVASKKLAGGDLRQRLPITGDEEIAALGASLNTMAENLHATIEKLSEGKQRLELILAAMGEGVMVLDGSGRITLTNSSMRNLLRTDRDLSGKTTLDVFRKPELTNAVSAVLMGQPAQVLELTRNGRVLQASVAPVPNAAGTVDSVVVAFHDLTDIRQTERIRRDFVANVSHEFKTPLTSIRGYAETLLSGAGDDPNIAAEFLKIIERNAKHLESLVTDLLMLARLESELPVLKETVEIRSIVEEEIAQRHAILRNRKIAVIVDCPAIHVQADRIRLSTAVSNLIDNAIHYNKPGGEIRIAGLMENGTFDLAITDTGVGIPPEELPRIFERFYRVDKARSRESGGTGLGLSIVKHAIESQGGSIRVSSRLGVGSTFIVRLQASDDSLIGGGKRM